MKTTKEKIVKKTSTKPKTAQNGGTPLLVTTAHRGVFFGYGTVTTDKIIRIEQARMCVYWTSDIKGVLGLASDGPGRNCKIGPAVSAITLQDVTAIAEVSPEAEKKWNAAPWG